jgi:hypothetical protein
MALFNFIYHGVGGETAVGSENVNWDGWIKSRVGDVHILGEKETRFDREIQYVEA